MLTHALGGVIPGAYLARKYQLRLFGCLAVMLMGGVAGILPDLYGGRDAAPWSHSVLFAPLLVLPLVLITKALVRTIPFGSCVLAYSASVIFGHLFFDWLDHEMPLLYPLSSESYNPELILIGDPLIVVLLALGCIAVFRRVHLRLALIPLLILGMYLGTKTVTKQLVLDHVKQTYTTLSDRAEVIVYPPSANLFEPRDALAWFQWGYDVYDTQRAIRALVPLLGPYDGGLHVNTFYTVSRDNFESSCQVIKEYREGLETILICQGVTQTNVYRYFAGWDEVSGADKERILSANAIGQRAGEE